MSFIEIHDLSLKRSNQVVLHGLHLSIEQSNIIAIIGPSGSGKTSLLRCLNRLETYEGTIQLGGQDIASLPVLDLRRRVGMIFQKTAAFSGSVADNIAFGTTLVGEDLAEAQIRDWMEQVSLPVDLMHRDAQELSGGQEQRLAIARALANQPDVLLLDEPTSALDPIATHHVEESLLRLRDTYHLTMLWVSHSVEQARRVADQVVLLNEGRVLSVDTVAAMLDPETGDPRALAFEQGDEIGLHQE